MPASRSWGSGSKSIAAPCGCCGCLPAFPAMQHHRVRTIVWLSSIRLKPVSTSLSAHPFSLFRFCLVDCMAICFLQSGGQQTHVLVMQMLAIQGIYLRYTPGIIYTKCTHLNPCNDCMEGSCTRTVLIPVATTFRSCCHAYLSSWPDQTSPS